VTKTRWNDGVALGHHDGDRYLRVRQMGQVVVVVTQQPVHRQPRVMVAGDVGEAVPGRDQPQRGDGLWRARIGRRRDARAEGFTGHQHGPGKVAARPRDRLRGIGYQRILARRARARAVARILGEDDAHSEPRQAGIDDAMPGVAGIAVEQHQRCPRRAFGFAQQAAKFAFCRPAAQLVVTGFGQQGGQGKLFRQVEQTILEHGDASGQQQSDDQYLQHDASNHHMRRLRHQRIYTTRLMAATPRPRAICHSRVNPAG